MNLEPNEQSSHSMSGMVSVRALWTVNGYKVTKGSAWGEEQARAMLFKPLDIDETKITFNGKTCLNVSFENKRMSAGDYLYQSYHTSPQELGMEEEEIEVIKTNCNLPGFSEYMRLKDRRLVINLNGVFFYFVPTVNY